MSLVTKFASTGERKCGPGKGGEDEEWREGEEGRKWGGRGEEF